MGFIGLLVTVLIMVCASWYLFLGPSSSSVTLENKSASSSAVESQDVAVPADANTVSGAQALIGQARGLKSTLESQAAATMAAGSEQGAGNNEQRTTNKDQGATNNEQGAGKLAITNRKVSFGFSVSSGRSIDTVVLHSSYDAIGIDLYSVSGTIKEYEGYGVAPHYLIDRQGKIYRLVDDKNIAYHAGESKMADGRTGVNAFSIGIELLNKEDDRYTDAQYIAVNDLITYLKGLYTIKYVVGHGDIAPSRKTDPWNFDWKKLR